MTQEVLRGLEPAESTLGFREKRTSRVGNMDVTCCHVSPVIRSPVRPERFIFTNEARMKDLRQLLALPPTAAVFMKTEY